jgi:integrase
MKRGNDGRGLGFPYDRVAVAVSDEIAACQLDAGRAAPRPEELASAHGVSLATAKRALLLAEWGELCRKGRGPLLIAPRTAPPPAPRQELPAQTMTGLFTVTLRRARETISVFATAIDLTSIDSLQRTLVDAIGRSGRDRAEVADYEMDVSNVGEPNPLLTFVSPS